MNIIKNLNDLLKVVGVDSKGELERVIYKYTDCGAWVATDNAEEVRLGSIVEGVDYVTREHCLTYPFTRDKFWRALEAIEEEAEQIWDDTHGCEDCGEEDPESGYTPINPDCKSCGGDGIVF